MPATPIQSPTGYTVSRAIAYADTDGTAVVVGTASPLPVMFGQPQGSVLAGSASASGVQGPFQPVTGRAVMLALSGSWTGTVKVTRSTDGGATKLPLTVAGAPWAQFTGNCCEAVWEESDPDARLYIDIALTSGSVTYRLAQ